jgi:hypothetical protein
MLEAMARQVLSTRLAKTAVRAEVERAVEVPAATLWAILQVREPPPAAVPVVPAAPITARPGVQAWLPAAAAAVRAPKVRLTRTAVPVRLAW